MVTDAVFKNNNNLDYVVWATLDSVVLMCVYFACLPTEKSIILCVFVYACTLPITMIYQYEPAMVHLSCVLPVLYSWSVGGACWCAFRVVEVLSGVGVCGLPGGWGMRRLATTGVLWRGSKLSSVAGLASFL